MEAVVIKTNRVRYDLLDRTDKDVKRSSKDLSESIQQVGLVNPIVVAPSEDGKTYAVVDGRRRLAAVKKLGWKTVTCVINDGCTGDISKFSIVANLKREEPNKIKRAEIIKHMLDESIYKNQQALATDWGVTQAWVSKQLSLLEIDDSTKEAIDEGELSTESAYKAVKSKRKALGRGKKSAEKRGKASKEDVVDVVKNVYKRLSAEALKPKDEGTEKDPSLSIAVGMTDIKFSINIPLKAVRGELGIIGYIKKQLKQIGESSIKKAVSQVCRREFS